MMHNSKQALQAVRALRGAKSPTAFRVKAIAAFLENGAEHGSDQENQEYLCSEFGLSLNDARTLLDAWQSALQERMDPAWNTMHFVKTHLLKG